MEKREYRRISFGADVERGGSGRGSNNDDEGEDTFQELAADKLEVVKKGPSQEDISDDDSSIEVLLTIQPPSPNKKKKKAASSSRPPSEVVMQTTPSENNDSAVANDMNGPASIDVGPSGGKECSEALQEEVSPVQEDRVDGSPTSELSTLPTTTTTKVPALKDPPVPQSSGAQTSLHSSPDTPVYSLLTSAYVQNLAEICHMVTSDQRWRVGGPDQTRLFWWEHGDDLSAVIPLARRFRPWPAPKEIECHGLLCDCKDKKKQAGEVNQNQPLDDGLVPSGDDCNLHEDDAHTSQQTSSTSSSSEKVGEESTSDLPNRSDEIRSPDDAQEDRCLHLYCRLFYRKGPWFRIDDAYSRYYSPKQLGQSPAAKAGTAKTPDATSEQASADRQQPHAKMPPPAATARKQDFFNRKPSATMKPTAGSTAQGGSIRGHLINEKLFQQHMEALAVFLKDLIRLREMGLVRSFFDEEECGKTVGTARVVLTQEERKQVLAKLGGGGRKKTNSGPSQQRRPSTLDSNARQGSRSSSTSTAVAENEIWNQMCTQKSISGQFTSQAGKHAKGVLLPVKQHVNQVLFDKLATRIVQSCSPHGYVSSAVMRRRKVAIKETISKVLGSFNTSPQSTRMPASGSHLESILGKFGMCIRLREAPLKALQRCARLMLCASSGPGQMRSDGGTNGWKSIQELDRNKVLENTKLRDAQYASNVEPPGAHSWYTVQYPGLQLRFGLSSWCFQQAFKPLPVQGERDGAEESQLEQIFSSRNAFLCWEMSAELRANVDYLVEVNELLLYNERKRVREGSGGADGKGGESAVEDGGGCKDTKQELSSRTGSSMDFLGLLTPSKRRDFVGAFVGGNDQDTVKICEQMELDILLLFSNGEDRQEPPMKTECERVLSVLAGKLLNRSTSD